MNEPVLPPVRPAFRAIAQTVVPESVSLDEQAWGEVERIVEHALAPRSEKIRRQVRLLIRVLDLLPLVRYGRRFRALGPARRLSFLDAMQSFPVLLIRRGVWGLRTLIFMGYYARPEGGAAIGYRADAAGWDARR